LETTGKPSRYDFKVKEKRERIGLAHRAGKRQQQQTREGGRTNGDYNPRDYLLTHWKHPDQASTPEFNEKRESATRSLDDPQGHRRWPGLGGPTVKSVSVSLEKKQRANGSYRFYKKSPLTVGFKKMQGGSETKKKGVAHADSIRGLTVFRREREVYENDVKKKGKGKRGRKLHRDGRILGGVPEDQNTSCNVTRDKSGHVRVTRKEGNTPAGTITDTIASVETRDCKNFCGNGKRIALPRKLKFTRPFIAKWGQSTLAWPRAGDKARGKKKGSPTGGKP